MAAGVGDIVRFALRWFVDGSDEIINVHTLRLLAGTALGDDEAVMEAIVDIMANTLYDEVDQLMPNNVTGFDASGINLTELEVMPPVAQTIDGLEATSESLARQLTALICLNGNQPRRQGRSYLPIFCEQSVADTGAWSSGTLSGLNAYAALLLAPMNNADLTIERVICHPDGTAPFLPTAALVITSPRTQRRRTEGFGS